MSVQNTFAALIFVQTLHSIEEYRFRLWETFPPADYLTSLVSADQAAAFLTLNSFLIALGVACLIFPIRRNWPSARAIAWGWVFLELMNGAVHPAWSVLQEGYTPGVVTALLLLPLAIVLGKKLLEPAAQQT